jgi:ElaB/YqjD/DUF883 family membrane-anchored ribosome-binding protein
MGSEGAMTDWANMTDKEFEEVERQANKDLREFKRKLKEKYPDLYKAIKQHEKENDEKDVLMVDLFSSKFASEVE